MKDMIVDILDEFDSETRATQRMLVYEKTRWFVTPPLMERWWDDIWDALRTEFPETEWKIEVASVDHSSLFRKVSIYGYIHRKPCDRTH